MISEAILSEFGDTSLLVISNHGNRGDMGFMDSIKRVPNDHSI